MNTAIRNDDPLLGPDILEAIKASGIEFIVSVPDIVTSEGLLRIVRTDTEVRHIPLCKEDEGISICTALSYCGKRSLLMMQQTGMFDSVNSMRAIAAGYGHPVCMLVGVARGRAAHPTARVRQAHRAGGAAGGGCPGDRA